MTKHFKLSLSVIAIIFLVIAGYGGAYVASLGALPAVQNAGSYVVLTLVLACILLALPYGLLKLLGYAMHLFNPHEKIPRLEDLPKDQDELNTPAS